MSKTSKRISFNLTKEECYRPVEEFYDLIAQKLGRDPVKIGYDCRKICVTMLVQTQIFAFYREQKGASDAAIAAAWINYGPKASLPGDGYFAEVTEDFLIPAKSSPI